MSERELKPCPFCGRSAVIEREGTRRQSMIVTCEDCGARMESGDVGQTDAWNRRAPAGESVTGWAEYLDGDESEGWSQWRFDGGSPNEDSHGRVRAVLTFIDSP